MSLLLFQTLFSYFIPGSYVLVWQKGNDVLTARNIMVSPDRRFKLQPDHTLGAKYFFFSSRSLKTREKYISFTQFTVQFLNDKIHNYVF